MLQDMEKPSATGDVSHIVVCVTGATGYLGEHIVKVLLERGFTVRGTVRDPSKTDKLKALLALPGASERLTIHRGNLLEPGSFDDAVAGCTYVIHSASPVALDVWRDPNESLVKPAVEGTQNVLHAVMKASSVRRVVVTSSIRSVFGFADEHPPGYLYTEEDWNTKASLENNQGYALSKLLGEKAAWELAEKSDGSWDLITINPGLIFGPMLSNNHKESSSVMLFQRLVTGQQPPIKYGWGVVDVRDVAKAHVAAIENLNAKGRYLINSDTATFREIVDFVRDKVRRPLLRFSMPKPLLLAAYHGGFIKSKLTLADIQHNVGYRMKFSNEKLKRDLMPEAMISPRDMARDMYDSLVEHGLVSKSN